VDALFASWLAQFTFNGGCTVTENGNTGSAPPFCGGAITINYDVLDDCGQTANCSATFTVDNAPILTINCPNDTTLANCQDQATVDALLMVDVPLLKMEIPVLLLLTVVEPLL
jgi:hypothetical protein